MRLVNRGNLGVARMFRAMLMEGKEPPMIEERGDSVPVTFAAESFSGAVRAFVAEEQDAGRELSVDNLIILQYLLRHPELETATAARICQRIDSEAPRDS